MHNINTLQLILSIVSGIVVMQIVTYIFMKIILLIQIYCAKRKNSITRKHKEGKFNKSLGVREIN